MTGRYERELLNALRAEGYTGVRIPASGAATERDLPDLLVGSRGLSQAVMRAAEYPLSQCFAIELKTTKSTTAYVDADEVAALERFADGFGATPLLACKFKRPGQRSTFWCVDPHDARMTDSGRYGLPIDDIGERARWVVQPATTNKTSRFERL